LLLYLMNRLDEFSVGELQDALDNVEKKPTQRLLAAVTYNNGVTQAELAEWYDVQQLSAVAERGGIELSKTAPFSRRS
jgi:hypothetical protein